MLRRECPFSNGICGQCPLWIEGDGQCVFVSMLMRFENIDETLYNIEMRMPKKGGDA